VIRSCYAKPSASVSRFVRSYYLIEVAGDSDAPVSDVLIPEMANLRIVLQGAIDANFGGGRVEHLTGGFVAGPSSQPRPIQFQGPTRVFGLGITPMGWAAMTTLPAHVAADLVLPLAAVLGDATAAALIDAAARIQDFEMLAAAINTILADHIDARRLPIPSLLPRLDHLITKAEIDTVDALAQALGISSRQLERLAARTHGFRPKLLMRRQRFLNAFAHLRRTPGLSWLDAAGLHYCDQSHFIRDFKAFTGAAPSVYFARRAPVLRPALAKRAEVIGAQAV
jgi:AraC-like DNA-binding protein